MELNSSCSKRHSTDYIRCMRLIQFDQSSKPGLKLQMGTMCTNWKSNGRRGALLHYRQNIEVPAFPVVWTSSAFPHVRRHLKFIKEMGNIFVHPDYDTTHMCVIHILGNISKWLCGYCVTPCDLVFSCIMRRTKQVWRYQRGNQKPQCEETHTIQWQEEHGQNDKKTMIYKTLHRHKKIVQHEPHKKGF